MRCAVHWLHCVATFILMKSEVYPNLVVGGAPKSGTSSLYFWLAAHPEVAASREKETFFWSLERNRFNKSCNVREHGPSAYARLFAHTAGSPVRFEATAAYLYTPEAWQGLAALPEPPLVLFVLREPAARTQSQYLFEKFRTGRINGSFADYLKEPGILDHGHYVTYLEHWEAAFGRDRIILWQFERVMRDPRSAMQSLALRLGIDPSFYADFDFTVRNETVAIRNKTLHQLGLRMQSMIPHGIQDALLPMYLKVNGGGRPQADAALKAQTAALKDHFAASNAALAERYPESIDLTWWT